ncbi:BnaAnng10250D [Brassica napus]|uniref:BnaAnng10250D protein n=1 Tax=Brassica napus TaxID=3708 RepID=A0A078IHZ8_BRANA|nr:BnaAnng10250D [Brassica napus]
MYNPFHAQILLLFKIPRMFFLGFEYQ